ncbi:MAG: sodium:solute symporter family protein [Lachnospiraceae bacterium]|nr:sodium:solute symporter family protein [Lachnospiraceae bacterium]
MNTIFLIALIIYIIVFLTIGILDIKKINSFADYAAAGKSQGRFAVIMTLLATVIGASTTIGITDTVYSIGFPGIWWLAFGGIGLILQAFIISKKVRSIDAITLPDMAGKIVGGGAEKLLAFIIVISWIGVIAGQLVAMNGIISFALGKNSKLIFALVSAIVIIYTLIGGQLSVIKTDRIQFVIIVLGILICCIYLYFVKGGNTSDIADGIELLNDNYKPVNLFTQFFVIGGVYFLGPDIMSRNFISKDEKTAKSSALIAGISLFVFAFIITLIGMWVRYNISAEELNGSKALMYVIGIVPKFVGILLVFGLLSAILSSTDTCIINASSIFVKDILGKDSVALVRITVGVIGVLATVFAISGNSDIISLLTNAYSIYTPGVIFPLLIAILTYGKRSISKGVWFAAVILGGLFGLLGAFLPDKLLSLGVPAKLLSYFTLIGMGVSLVISLLSIKSKQDDGSN